MLDNLPNVVDISSVFFPSWIYIFSFILLFIVSIHNWWSLFWLNLSESPPPSTLHGGLGGEWIFGDVFYFVGIYICRFDLYYVYLLYIVTYQMTLCGWWGFRFVLGYRLLYFHTWRYFAINATHSVPATWHIALGNFFTYPVTPTFFMLPHTPTTPTRSATRRNEWIFGYVFI